MDTNDFVIIPYSLRALEWYIEDLSLTLSRGNYEQQSYNVSAYAAAAHTTRTPRDTSRARRNVKKRGVHITDFIRLRTGNQGTLFVGESQKRGSIAPFLYFITFCKYPSN